MCLCGMGEETVAEQGQDVQKQHKRDQEGQEGRKVEKDWILKLRDSWGMWGINVSHPCRSPRGGGVF